MAVKTREEIMTSIRARLGDDTSDETLQFIEDVTDTLNEYETKAGDTTDWKKRYEDNDKEWRQKYRDRFFNGSDDNSNNENDSDNGDENKEPLTFDSLFKTGE